ncbi:MAG: hypothetical protein IPI49_06635 [Myxococcales bacterium]|nr:hypothetical protein [Myxococcales bacterium]
MADPQGPPSGPPADPARPAGGAAAEPASHAEHAEHADHADRADRAELAPRPASPGHPDDALPVVARLVVEIRSDGSRTIARGAIEDTVMGQRVAVEARGDSPLALALALARSISSLPRLSARAAVRGLLGRRQGK